MCFRFFYLISQMNVPHLLNELLSNDNRLSFSQLLKINDLYTYWKPINKHSVNNFLTAK